MAAWIGYDLFQEAAYLLTSGQPAEHASVPALEMHIAVLRGLLREAGLPFVEIPPVPHGYDFIGCLTHDVDFGGIRNYGLDHTTLGFLYRATLGSCADALKGKSTWRRLWKNLGAVLRLPAVHAGVARDFWILFERYLEMEKGKSTFFFIPFKGRPGESPLGTAPSRRAAGYDVHDLHAEIAAILRAGGEVGLHGIDAWRDTEKGTEEVEEISRAAGAPVSGARIHWLYFSQDSPGTLERAGLNYDSTIGYNQTIGFRAGTAQAYRPLDSRNLLELPLVIQDTALFYPDRMGLGEEEAGRACSSLIKTMSRVGGALVVNWHDRSLSPERLWDSFYAGLLAEIRSFKVWFATGSEAAGWFRKRRAVHWDWVGCDGAELKGALGGVEGGIGPDLCLRIYNTAEGSGAGWCETALAADLGPRTRSFSYTPKKG